MQRKGHHMNACTMEWCILSIVVPHLLKTWQKHCFYHLLKQNCLGKFSCFKKNKIRLFSQEKMFNHLLVTFEVFHYHLDEVQKTTSEACFMCKEIHQYRTFFLAALLMLFSSKLYLCLENLVMLQMRRRAACLWLDQHVSKGSLLKQTACLDLKQMEIMLIDSPHAIVQVPSSLLGRGKQD